MVVHNIFDNRYTSFVIAVILCLLIVFIEEIDIFKNVISFYIVLFIIFLMVSSNIYDDYGFLLLLIALLILIYVQTKKGNNSKI